MAEDLRIGFTGTRGEPSEAQLNMLREVLTGQLKRGFASAWFHHGDCQGADEQAGNIAADRCYNIMLHPPIDEKHRAHCKYSGVTVIELPKKDFLKRNHDIVDATQFLIAVPKEFKEVLRSGTWATIRYALKTGKEVWIIQPDGKMEIRK